MTTNIPTRLFYTFAGIGALYASLFAALLLPWSQRQALYVHWLQTWSNPDIPEAWGFAQGQVTPFRVRTADGESFYAWHVMPLGLWMEHEDKVLSNRQTEARGRSKEDDGRHGLGELQLRLLRDTNARVVLNCKSSHN